MVIPITYNILQTLHVSIVVSCLFSLPYIFQQLKPIFYVRFSERCYYLYIHMDFNGMSWSKSKSLYIFPDWFVITLILKLLNNGYSKHLAYTSNFYGSIVVSFLLSCPDMFHHYSRHITLDFILEVIIYISLWWWLCDRSPGHEGVPELWGGVGQKRSSSDPTRFQPRTVANPALDSRCP